MRKRIAKKIRKAWNRWHLCLQEAGVLFPQGVGDSSLRMGPRPRFGLVTLHGRIVPPHQILLYRLDQITRAYRVLPTGWKASQVDILHWTQRWWSSWPASSNVDVHTPVG